MADLRPTPYAVVNAVLADFHARIAALFGGDFKGMYVIGSLALGDFDPAHSDIDFVVVIGADIDDDRFDRLREIHARFAAGHSPWAERVEAVYITEAALRSPMPDTVQYPQVEKGTALFRAPLEDGWVFQLQTLRQYALVVSGGDLRTQIDPIHPEDMRPAVKAIAGTWLEQSRNEPEWLDWVRERNHQLFVIQTLCRMLYSLATGDVASKPRAVQWGQTHLGQPWAALIADSLARQHVGGEISPDELNDTIAFIRYTALLESGSRNAVSDTITYTDSAEGVRPDQLTGFFVGWPNPPSPETHVKILEGSSHVLLAWADERVVGYITAISDGVSAAYIPHLEVLPHYQGRGIGSELVRRMLEGLKRLYMIDLTCDPDVQSFYERLGMRRSVGMLLRNYDRQRCD